MVFSLSICTPCSCRLRGHVGRTFGLGGLKFLGIAGDNGRVYRGECLGNPDIA